jgi:hypothetical protein
MKRGLLKSREINKNMIIFIHIHNYVKEFVDVGSSSTTHMNKEMRTLISGLVQKYTEIIPNIGRCCCVVAKIFAPLNQSQ